MWWKLFKCTGAVEVDEIDGFYGHFAISEVEQLGFTFVSQKKLDCQLVIFKEIFIEALCKHTI
jgi:hypothetical protein